MNKTLLQCNKLCKSYQEGKTQTVVLKNIDFSLRQGEMVSIVGNSGSGKSTFLHLVGGLDIPTSGEVIFLGKKMSKMSSTTKANLRNRNIGFVYQLYHLLLDFTVLENIAIPLLISGKKKSEIITRTNNLLKLVGLSNKEDFYPSELSGGERQRVAIARALINNPQLVLADEPTGNLDTYNTSIILELFNNINTIYNTTFLIVTHNLQLANSMDRQLKMRDGQLI